MAIGLTQRQAEIYAEFIRRLPEHSSEAAARDAVAKRFGLSENTVRKYVGKAKRVGAHSHAPLAQQTPFPANPVGKTLPQPDEHGRVKVDLPKIETFVFTGELPNVAVPVFTGQWRFELDECMIAGDFHLPSCKLGYVQRMCQLAERHMKGKRTLLIAGDIHNGDKDSRHAPLVPPISRAQELNLTKALLDYLLGYFDEIYMEPGNHMRKRFMELLDGDLNFSQYTQLITSHPSRVHLSPYDIIYLKSGGDDWVITHQYQYSKNKLIKANQLAQKYQASVITFHQHHTAIGRDEFDRYTIVDCGGFHDQDMMAYTSLVPSTFPRMNNAFVYMRRGTAHLMSHYRGITDWSLWLPEFDDKEPKTVNPVIPFRTDIEEEVSEDEAADVA